MTGPSQPVLVASRQPRVAGAGPRRRDLLFLWALGIVVACAVARYGGVLPAEWNLCLIGLSLVTALFWLPGAACAAEPLTPGLRWLPVFLVFYTAIQLLPLPDAAFTLLSPARREIAEALAAFQHGTASRTISVAPALTLAHLVRLIACFLMFVSIRELTVRFGNRASVTVVPLVLVATAEAVLGLWQSLAGAQRATGTYVNANHFACLLEMCLPFAVLFAANAMRDRWQADGEAVRHLWLILRLCFAVLAIAAALLDSLSRTGSVACLVSLAALGVLRCGGSRWRRRTIIMAVALPIVVAAVLFLTVPNDLLDRFADTGSPAGNADVRFPIWRETLGLIAAYPVFGSGLGTYASAMQRYRIASIPLALVDYAHNDYLQLLAEWGLVGFSPALTFALRLLARAFRRATGRGTQEHRWLGAACFTSLLALGLHSFADFNLYIPANALVASWVAGVAVGIPGARALDLTERAET